MKIYRKIAMFVLMAALTFGTLGMLSLNASAAGNGEFDGDIISNPFGNLFETTARDLHPSTTKRNDSNTKVKVKSTAIKSAKKVKKSAKVRISLKKVKGAAKYQVQISKTKKFKKVVLKKTVKKTRFTLKSRKLKNKKKLYVRARAIKKVGKKTYRSKWSKVKKVKMKK